MNTPLDRRSASRARNQRHRLDWLAICAAAKAAFVLAGSEARALWHARHSNEHSPAEFRALAHEIDSRDFRAFVMVREHSLERGLVSKLFEESAIPELS